MTSPRRKTSADRAASQQKPAGINSIWLQAVLILAVVLTFGRIVEHDFVAWDDEGHISENPHLNPISIQSLARFWREPYFLHYVPVSYTLFTAEAWLAQSSPDQFGRPVFDPRVFHAVSLLLHVACALLAYRLLLLMLHQPLAAVIGAGLFALHPFQVESVAWISEQRGLLSALFSFLSLLAWLRFNSGIQPRPVVAGSTSAAGGWRWYALATAAYLLALLAKPSGVCVPLIAAALDLFLLRRSWRVTLLALLPWLAMAAGMFAITKQQQPDEMLSFQPPWWARPLIAGDALQFYLTKFVWPWKLTIQYPRSPQMVLAHAGIYVAWIWPAVLLALAYRFRSQGPWMVCAGWFLAALAPVLGLAPFAYQHYSTVADRYVYLALFAPALALGWCVRQRPSQGVLALAALPLIGLAALSFQQAGHWRDNEALFSHALRLNPQSEVAHAGWGSELLRRQRFAEALRHLDEGFRLNPHTGTEKVLLNRGLALLGLGRVDEAIEVYEQTLSRYPHAHAAHLNLSAAYFQKQDWENTIHHARAALLVEPESVAARFNLALALDRQGRDEESTSELHRLLEYWPQQFEAHMKLASKLRAQGRLPESLEHFSAGVASHPEDRAARFDYALALTAAGRDAQALQQLRILLGQPASDWPLIAAHAAWLLATRTPQAAEEHHEALQLAEAACRRTEFQDPVPLRALAAAQAAVGQSPAAEKTARRARDVARAADRLSLAAALENDLQRYRTGLPAQAGVLNP